MQFFLFKYIILLYNYFMEIEVIKFDNLGRGIGYINNKIIFIPKSVPGDILKIDIVKEKKNYLEGRIKEIIKPSKLRKKVLCPYFASCGGCDLLNISLSEELEYKLHKINAILKKNNINYEVKEIIKNSNEYYYRNKITLKVINKKIGYYQGKTHNLLEINNCLVARKSINALIKEIDKFSIINGEVTIRCNNKEELLIIINSSDKLANIEYFVSNYNIVGIVLNGKCLYGEDYFIHSVNNHLFKISYNAFFQVNDYISSYLFNLINKYTTNSHNVLDLYCGVGALSLNVSDNVLSVLGVEIVENAIKDANFNKGLNKKENVSFICSDTKNILNKISKTYDTVILDPPRCGVDEKVLKKIIDENINKIIYVSCDPFTLVRDLKILNDNYEIKDFHLLDMFTWSEHVESFCVLEKR